MVLCDDFYFIKFVSRKAMDNNEIVQQKLNPVEKHIFGLKAILNVEELSDYTGFKKSYIYKLVHTHSLPFSKPNGEILFFERTKIDEWLLKTVINQMMKSERKH